MVLQTVHIQPPTVYSLTKYMSMTKITATSYIAFLLMAGSLVGVTATQASEVTGTLSSDASSNTQTSGNISGTVTGESSGGGSSSGGRSNRNNNSSDEPSGEVLGASTDTIVPGFPNAGFAPEGETPVPTLWSRMIIFFSTIVSPMH